MKGFLTFFALVLGLSISTGQLFAHHGRGNRYERSEIELKGTVQSLAWRNPHVAIFIDVEDDNGDVVTWNIEHSNVSTLARRGYSRNTLRPGQEVTIVVNPGTGGKRVGLCQLVILADGTEIFRRGEGVD